MSTLISSFTPVLRRSQLCANFLKPFIPLLSSSDRLASPAPINCRGNATATTSVFSSSSSSSSSAVVESSPELVSVKEISTSKGTLGCPVSFDPLTWTGSSSLSLESTPGTTLDCNTCKKVYYGNEAYFDLTASSGAKNYSQTMPPVTELFRIPVISFIYERGWRQIFWLSGFPGTAKEIEMTKEYLKPAFGGKIVDASCDRGVFSRLFAKSELFSLVTALDYSEGMSWQCYEFVKEDPVFPKDRVLRPGGVFVASTSIADSPFFTLLPFRRYFRENIQQLSGLRIFLSDSELEDLCTTCGLVGFKFVRDGPYIVISATKPS